VLNACDISCLSRQGLCSTDTMTPRIEGMLGVDTNTTLKHVSYIKLLLLS